MVELPGINTFLKAEDIGAAAIVTFMNEGEFVGKDQTGFDHDVFNIDVKLPNQETKAWTMNKTSQRMVAAKFGTDTKNWVGKTVNLIVTDQNVRGEMKKVIYVQGEQPAPQVNTTIPGQPQQTKPGLPYVPQ